MSKNLKIILSLIAILVIVITFIFVKPKSDAIKFKLEYESLNGKTNSSGKEYLSLNIPSDNKITYIDYEKAFEILDGTGVIYFGFPECPWCRNIISVLLDAAKTSGIEKIYYLNNHNDRDTKILKDGEVITEKEGTKNYYKLLEKLGSSASAYEGLEDENIKRIYFPAVVFVKDGKIIKYVEGTASTVEDPYQKLNEEEEKELKETYSTAFSALLTCGKDKC